MLSTQSYITTMFLLSTGHWALGTLLYFPPRTPPFLVSLTARDRLPDKMGGIFTKGAIAAVMEGQEEKLHQLVTEACSYQVGSAQRQKNLTKIIRLVTNKLWKENTPYYQDALQQTWVYFCQNICEGNTGEPYNPSRGSVITWLNFYLKRRLQDFYIDNQKQKAKTVSNQAGGLARGDSEFPINAIENIPSEPYVPSLLEEVKIWVETDPDGQLNSIHIANHPEITAKVLILRRLPPETSWKTLAVEYNLSISTLSSFYQRQCLPRLRKFGELEGYL